MPQDPDRIYSRSIDLSLSPPILGPYLEAHRARVAARDQLVANANTMPNMELARAMTQGRYASMGNTMPDISRAGIAMQGPPMPTMGPPVSQEMQDLGGVLADVLTQQLTAAPQYQFGSIGKGLLGGLFNLVGGVFGNDDLGGELFGSRSDRVNPSDIANTLVQMAGLKEERAARKEKLALDRELFDRTLKHQTEMNAMEHKQSMELEQKRIDARASELEKQYGYSRSLARAHAAAEMDKLDALQKHDLVMLNRQLQGQGNLAAQAFWREHAGKLQELGVKYNLDMKLVESQQDAQAAEGAANRQSAERISAERNASQERIAATETAGRIASANTANQPTVKEQRENLGAALSDQGRAANLVDEIAKLGGPSVLLNDPNIGIRRRVFTVGSLDEISRTREITPEEHDKMYSWVADEVAKYYTSDPDASKEEALAHVQTVINSYKQAALNGLASVRDTKQQSAAMPGTEQVDPKISAALESAIGAQASNLVDVLPFAVEQVAQNNQIRLSLTQHALLNDKKRPSYSSALYGIPSPAAPDELSKWLTTKQPSLTDPTDAWRFFETQYNDKTGRTR